MTIDYDDLHQITDGLILNLCKKCGGQCEYTQVRAFLPGETEYIAQNLNIENEIFIKKYCSVLDFKNFNIILLRLGICPFLNQNKRCELELIKSKPIMCIIYPFIIKMMKNTANLVLDEDFCPMTDLIPKKFHETAKKVFKAVKDDIPGQLLDFLSNYDQRMYDYSKLKKIRNETNISFSELKKLIIQ